MKDSLMLRKVPLYAARLVWIQIFRAARLGIFDRHAPEPLDQDYLDNTDRRTTRRIEQADTPRYDNAASAAAQQQNTGGDRSLQGRLDSSRRSRTLDLSGARRRLGSDEESDEEDGGSGSSFESDEDEEQESEDESEDELDDEDGGSGSEESSSSESGEEQESEDESESEDELEENVEDDSSTDSQVTQDLVYAAQASIPLFIGCPVVVEVDEDGDVARARGFVYNIVEADDGSKEYVIDFVGGNQQRNMVTKQRSQVEKGWNNTEDEMNIDEQEQPLHLQNHQQWTGRNRTSSVLYAAIHDPRCRWTGCLVCTREDDIDIAAILRRTGDDGNEAANRYANHVTSIIGEIPGSPNFNGNGYFHHHGHKYHVSHGNSTTGNITGTCATRRPTFCRCKTKFKYYDEPGNQRFEIKESDHTSFCRVKNFLQMDGFTPQQRETVVYEYVKGWETIYDPLGDLVR